MDFLESDERRAVTEFQAVILAGYGNALAPLTNDHGESSSPKALLPVANKPIISFPLTWLDEAGLTNVLLLCPHSHRAAIAHYVHSDIASSTFSTLRIDIQTCEEDEASSLGTASILRKFANRIKNDFVLLPCDFLPPPSLHLSAVLNDYRADPEDTIISTLFYEVKTNDDKDFLEDSVQHHPLVVYDKKTATLLYVDYAGDAEDDELELRMRMLWKYPNLRITTCFSDSHVYVCRRSVLAVLAAKPTLDSVREDLIPFLCKIQYRKGKRLRWEPGKFFLLHYNRIKYLMSKSFPYTVLNQVMNNLTGLPAHHPSVLASSAWRSATTSQASSAPESPLMSDTPKMATSNLRCGIAIHTLDQGVAVRVNNLKTYADINRLFLQDSSPYLTPSTSASEHIDARAQVSEDSIIGPSTRIGERSVIKKSVVGQHCVIGKSVRISGSVLMDHVVVEDGAKIDGCLLGRSTRVGSKAGLAKTITQSGYDVESGVTLKGEKLEIAEWDPHAAADGD